MKKILGVAALALSLIGCTKQQTTAVVNEIAKIGVDFCKEAPALAPPSAAGVVSLICQVYDNSEKTVQVLVDRAVWNSMKANYLAQHGSLPRGMTAPTER